MVWFENSCEKQNPIFRIKVFHRPRNKGGYGPFFNSPSFAKNRNVSKVFYHIGNEVVNMRPFGIQNMVRILLSPLLWFFPGAVIDCTWIAFKRCTNRSKTKAGSFPDARLFALFIAFRILQKSCGKHQTILNFLVVSPI